MPARVGGSDGPKAADKDRAETFEEPDVTVSSSAARVSSGSVEIGSTGPSRPQDNNSFDSSYGEGLTINPNTDISKIDVTISSGVGEVSEVFITDTSENILDSVSGTFGPGDVVRLNAPLSQGTDYWVGAWDGGDTYQEGQYNSTVATAGDDLDIVAGARRIHPDDGSDGYTSTGEGFNIVSVQTPALSATATVEWPHPIDLYGWDTALYQKTDDGETIEIYIEENQADGWTEVAGPISRGDAIPADRANNVRYRIELSRSTTDANPTLDAIYRRYKL
jgi:hypothetical protein